MSFINSFFEKIDLMLTEKSQSDKYISWSSTKVGIFFFLYPVASWCMVYDTWYNGKLDWTNLAVFGLLIISPRALSNLVAIKLGGQPIKDEEAKPNVPQKQDE